MKRRIWGQFHTIKGDDLTKIGEFYREAIEGLGGGFGPGRMGSGFRVVPGSSGSKAKLTAGWALLSRADGVLSLVQVSDAEVDFSSHAAGTYDIVGTVGEVAEITETITPPPQILPNGNDNPFYDARFSSYLLDVAVKQTVSLSIQNSPHTPAGAEVVIATVFWDGNTITQSDIIEKVLAPSPELGPESVHGFNLNPDTAGLGLYKDTTNDNLAVRVDNSSIKIDETSGLYVANVTDAAIGSRTVDDGLVPTDDVGSLSDLLSNLANRIKTITGKANWYEGPELSIQDIANSAAFLAQNETITGEWTFSSNKTNIQRVRVTATEDVTLTSTAHGFQIGADSGANIAIDANEIMARNNGSVAPLYLNGSGGTIKVNTETSVGSSSPIVVGAEGYKVWHEGNDGSDSGLDADRLDGLDSTQFLRSDTSDIATGQIVFAAPDGVTLTKFMWKSDGSNARQMNAFANDSLAGFSPVSGGNNVAGGDLYFSFSASHWIFEATPYVGTNEMIHAGNIGNYTSSNADRLDGLDSTQFLRSDVSDSAAGQIRFVAPDGVTLTKFLWKSDGSNDRQMNAFASDLAAGFSPANGVSDVAGGNLYFLFSASHWVFETTPYVGTNEMIHAGNIGNYTSSNADRLDGLDSTQFLRSDTSDIATGQIVFAAPDGVTLTKFMWKSDGSNARQMNAVATDLAAGFSPVSGGNDVASGDLYFLFSASHWVFETTPYVGTNEMIHAGNIGNYTSSNADRLDGLDSTQFLRSDVDDSFTGTLLTVGSKMTVGGTAAPASGALAVDGGGIEVRSTTATWRMYVGVGDVLMIEKV